MTVQFSTTRRRGCSAALNQWQCLKHIFLRVSLSPEDLRHLSDNYGLAPSSRKKRDFQANVD